MMGDAGTGKTALVSQFMTSEYMHTYDASLGKSKGKFLSPHNSNFVSLFTLLNVLLYRNSYWLNHYCCCRSVQVDNMECCMPLVLSIASEAQWNWFMTNLYLQRICMWLEKCLEFVFRFDQIRNDWFAADPFSIFQWNFLYFDLLHFSLNVCEHYTESSELKRFAVHRKWHKFVYIMTTFHRDFVRSNIDNKNQR